MVDAAGVRQEVPDGNGRPGGSRLDRAGRHVVARQHPRIGELRQIFSDLVVELEESGLAQLKNTGGDDGLGQGGDRKQVVDLQERILVDAPSPERVLTDDTIMPPDRQHRSGHATVGHGARDERRGLLERSIDTNSWNSKPVSAMSRGDGGLRVSSPT